MKKSVLFLACFAVVGMLNAGGIGEEHKTVNLVNVAARHCQKYIGQPNGLTKCNADPSTLFYSHTAHNDRMTAGADWQASVMGNTSAPPATANWIGLAMDSSNANLGTKAASDTTLASSGTGSTEIALNGLARGLVAAPNGTNVRETYAHTNGTASYTISKQFVASGTQPSNKTGLFNASSAGTMVFENLYSMVTVNSGDTLTVTWTVNY